MRALKQLTHGSLFAGIGGFDLGFERAGIKTVWQVEIDPFCRRVLERHFPGVQRFDDIRECRYLSYVDIITGGFPRQPHSQAGRRKGTSDERWLWPEYLRIVRELRPLFVVVENVAGLLTSGMGDVLGGLASSGYDAEWQSLPAAAFGAPHIRERVWIIARERNVADPEGMGWGNGPTADFWPTNREGDASWDCRGVLADSPIVRMEKQQLPTERQIPVADADRSGEIRHSSIAGFPDWAGGEMGQPKPLTEFERPSGREIERDFRGIPHGVSRRVDRLKSLGNALLPQIAEWIGRRILATCDAPAG
jgi:DNA (cytosine-5)-methyltransferase 1